MRRFYPLTLALLLTAGVWFSSVTHGYYGNDDRQDIYELSGENLEDADSAVALFPDFQVQDLGDGTAALLTVNYGEYCNLCPSERFREQPIGAFCSGVLLAPDIIATAAHCIEGENIADIRFVFGYHMRDETTPELVINNRDIYSGVEVIAWQLDDNTGADWALIRLNRTVVNHRVARIRESGSISDGQAVHIIGHPMGLPAKFADGAYVRDNRFRAFFVTNLDAYPGNSGSPVFNSTTHEVEGILVRGDGDGELVKQGDCFVSRVCPDDGCGGEDSTRTTEFVEYVAWLH
jgi:V8-like Glu-specific endopeptidase